MKCEIVGSDEQYNTPKVGECFAYRPITATSIIYKRIEESVGIAVSAWHGKSKNSNHIFYAEIIETGLVVSISNPNFILLEQVEPAKFKVKE